MYMYLSVQISNCDYTVLKFKFILKQNVYEFYLISDISKIVQKVSKTGGLSDDYLRYRSDA